jgi:hypothetical protein
MLAIMGSSVVTWKSFRPGTLGELLRPRPNSRMFKQRARSAAAGALEAPARA